jgi:hypothetical protein
MAMTCSTQGIRMYMTLMGKPEVTPGRSRCLWEDNGMVCVYLVRDRGQWGALVNTVMNLRVP